MCEREREIERELVCVCVLIFIHNTYIYIHINTYIRHIYAYYVQCRDVLSAVTDGGIERSHTPSDRHTC